MTSSTVFRRLVLTVLMTLVRVAFMPPSSTGSITLFEILGVCSRGRDWVNPCRDTLVTQERLLSRTKIRLINRERGFEWASSRWRTENFHTRDGKNVGRTDLAVKLRGGRGPYACCRDVLPRDVSYLGLVRAHSGDGSWKLGLDQTRI